MIETAIELGIPILPALAIGWVASVSVSDGQMLTERWYACWLRLAGIFAIVETIGFLACRLTYRLARLMVQ